MSRTLQKQQHNRQTRRARLEELEPRILYSADFIPALLDDTVAAPEQRVIDTGGEFAQQAATGQGAETCRHELVLVESDTPDYQKLVDDIVKQDDPSRDIKVVVLDRNRDGVAQITSILSQYQDLSAVHLIAHGSDGQVQLGTTNLNFDTLLKSAAQIKGWGKAFGAGGDLLLYGCGVAQHADGKALVNALAALTGADVAASDDPTGQRDLGGDWELEYQDGTVETHLAITIRAQLDWRHALAVPVAANDTYSVNEDSTLTVAPATTTSLVDWYELDGSGNSQTIKDSVPPADNGRRGSTGGGDATDPTWTAGRIGSGALSFDGIDDYVTTPSTVLKTANNFTIAAWFQTNTTTGQHPILWQGYSGGSGYGDPGLNNPSSSELSLSVGTYDQDNKITFFLGYDVPGSGNGADPIYIVSARNFTDTVGWHHVGVTVSDLGGGVLSGGLYVDGVLEGTDTGIQNDRSQWGDLRMGDTGANSSLLDGKIDDVRLHDTALSAAQVQGLARAGVLQNDTDTNQKGLSAVLVAGPANGTLSLNADGGFFYTPNANFAGSDTFTYRANDGTASSNIATATIIVNPVNDPPVLGANALTLNQGDSVLLSAANLSASDVDNAAGSLSFNISNISSGRFEYVSAPGAAITSFTQDDVAGGLVRFVHDGSGTAAAYDVSVSDGSLGVGPIAASIAFSPAPLPAPAPPPPPPMLNNAPPVKPPAPSPTEPAPVQPASMKPLTAVVPAARPALAPSPAEPAPVQPASTKPLTAVVPPGRPEVFSPGRPQALVPKAQLNTFEGGGRAPATRYLPVATLNHFTPGPHIDPTLELLVAAAANLQYVPSVPADWHVQSAFPDNAETPRESIEVLLGHVEMGSMALSVGVVWWASRISGLLGSLLASAPAWRHIDPLPVVEGDEEKEWYGPDGRDADANELAIGDVFEGGRTAGSASQGQA